MKKSSLRPAPSIGLALGSGSARGLSHVGILKALDEAEIPIHYIAGTSIGALIGAVYAAGEIEAFESFLHEVDWKIIASYCDFVLPRLGLLQGDKIYRLMEKFLPKQTFEDLHIPLATVATNLVTGEEVRFTSGDLYPAVRASMSMPGILQPLKIDNRYLVDGALVNPVPVNAVREMGADLVIAVDLLNDVTSRNESKRKIKTSRRTKKKRDRALAGHTDNGNKWVFNRLEGKYRAMVKPVKKKIQNWKENRLSEENDSPNEPNIFDVISCSINIMGYQITQKNISADKPEIYITPDVDEIGLFDYDDARLVIQEGYETVQTKIDEIRSIIENWKPARPAQRLK